MTAFRRQLEKVFEFFKPENLAQQTLKYEGEIALLLIDVQKTFCYPEAEPVFKKIQSIVPEFRKAGIPVYAVYFGDKKSNPADIDFHEFTPHPDDVLVAKTTRSAFQSSNIKELLQKDKRKLLLVCGFNLMACVKFTVMDARAEGFDVCLLRDLSGGVHSQGNPQLDERCLAEMRNKGVAIEQSEQVLELVRAKKNLSSKQLGN